SPGIEVLPGTLQAFRDGALVKVHVHPSIDYRVEATGTRSCPDGGNTLGVPVGVNKSANTMVSVFQVGPAGACIGKAIDEFLRRHSITILQVCRDRQRHSVSDTSKRAQRDIGRKVAVI